MPSLNVTVTDADLARLEETGSPNGLSARRVAERILHRTMSVQSGEPRQTHRVRATERARRQLLLVRELEENGGKLTREQIQKFAETHGVSERAIYRDLLVAEGVAKQPANGVVAEV